MPPLSPEKVSEYTSIFENAGSRDGILPGNIFRGLKGRIANVHDCSGDIAKQIFERARLPNEVLGRVWNLADTEQRGFLDVTGFIIAMHLLASYKNGSLRALPQILPPGLYEVASRRGAPQRQMTGVGSRPMPGGFPVAGMQRQFSTQEARSPSSPMARQAFSTPPLSAQTTGIDWAISPQDKAQFDNIYTSVDKANRGFITGEQAVAFFSNSRLPEDILAQIWDLADIKSEGQLNRDEFAVAMYLIRQQRGKRDGRSVLPSTLPADLIPPSMRRQPIPPSQPTAPVFDNAANITAPRSASADLFGLDAISPQVAQSTGGSTVNTSNTPQRISESPQQSQSSSIFKPFVPSSTFGQNMISSQTTGGSASGLPTHGRGPQQQQQPYEMDDLLGDNDPEISKHLTQETTELANLSNQVGTLSRQMQEVKTKRSSTEQELSRASSQKRDFESRLAQLRSLYEHEVKEVRNLEDRLSVFNNDTKKLQQEIAETEGTLQDLQNQHRQTATALQTDQEENSSLKERIRQTNTEIAELKSQLERVRSDARQQKGLVAINKKQLATNEAERDNLHGELDGASRELDEATREAEESRRMVQPPSQVQNPPPVVSPAASTSSQSMNPFFRRVPTIASETTTSPLPFRRQPGASEDNSMYDSVFGTSYDSSTTASGIPNTSSRNEPPNQVREMPPVPPSSGQFGRPAEGSDLQAPSASPPPSTYNDPPQTTEPPAPPKSRQITSSFLPFRDTVQRSDSVSSSVKVSAPASRFGGEQESAVDAPTGVNASEGQNTSKNIEGNHTWKRESTSSRPSSPYLQRTSSASPTAIDQTRRASKTAEQRDPYQEFGQPSLPGDIPGAFPGEPTLPVQPQAPSDTGGSNRGSEDASNSRLDPSALEKNKVGGSKTVKDDFDAAFAEFGVSKPLEEAQNNDDFSSPDSGKVQKEFPPIQDLGADDDSDSASEQGFDDDFTAASPHRRQPSSNEVASRVSEPKPDANNRPKDLALPRPSMLTMGSTASQLPPTPGAQMSPPTYEQTVHPHNGDSSSPRDANQFPPEFTGLLPAREDPTSSPPVSQSPERIFKAPSSGGQALFNAPSGSHAPFNASSRSLDAPNGADGISNAPSGPSFPSDSMSRAPPNTYESIFPDHARPPAQQQFPQHMNDIKAPADDFDDAFADLADAREADDKGDDEFGGNHRDGFDEFNPIFDSPATTKLSTLESSSSTIQPEATFQASGNSIGGFPQSSTAGQLPQQSLVNSPHDWDAIFAGIDTSQAEVIKPNLPPRDESSFPTSRGPAGPLANRVAGDKTSSNQPPLGRALTASSEHDDPILKRLTGMGYPRDRSLEALEKFDYNIDKVSGSRVNITSRLRY